MLSAISGIVTVRHIKAGPKLVTLKTMLVCKLELPVALLGAQMARFVGESLKRGIDARFYWADSSTVRLAQRKTQTPIIDKVKSINQNCREVKI